MPDTYLGRRLPIALAGILGVTVQRIQNFVGSHTENISLGRIGELSTKFVGILDLGVRTRSPSGRRAERPHYREWPLPSGHSLALKARRQGRERATKNGKAFSWRWRHFYQMRDLFVAFIMVVTPERGCMRALSAAIRQCRIRRKSQSERTLGDNCVSRPGPVETNRAVVPPSQRTPLGL
jgi:hypothetical protein